MTVGIVIINYKTPGLTVDCLRSLEPEVAAFDRDTGHTLRVIVTDNASGDDSVEKIAQSIAANGWSPWATLVPNPRNGGFSYGNNRGIELMPEAAYVLLLNSDTVVRPGAIRAMFDFMEARRDVGITGSRLEDPDGTPQRSAFRFPTVRSELESSARLGVLSKLLRGAIVAPPAPDAPCRTDWVPGASMLIRRDVFEKIGLLDEGYFMYFEDVDFCLKASRAGFACWYVPQARIVHLVGGTSGVTAKTRNPKRRPAYWFEARNRFLLKNYGPVKKLAADLAWTVGFSAFRLRQTLLKKPSGDPPNLLSDFVRHNFIAPAKGTAGR